MLVGIAAIIWAVWKTCNVACFRCKGRMIPLLLVSPTVVRLLITGLVCRKPSCRSFFKGVRDGCGKSRLRWSTVRVDGPLSPIALLLERRERVNYCQTEFHWAVALSEVLAVGLVLLDNLLFWGWSLWRVFNLLCGCVSLQLCCFNFEYLCKTLWFPLMKPEGGLCS